jgi:small neutral amino acid transporter SnatA (MarC family)
VSLVKFFLDVFVTLFVIIDPAGTVPVFLGLTRGRSDRDRKRLTDYGVELVTRVAGLLLAAIAVQLVANSAIAFTHSA